MDGAMAGLLASMAFSKAASEACSGPGAMKISVEAHHTTTIRETPVRDLKSRMSLRSASASSRFEVAGLTLVPCNRLT